MRPESLLTILVCLPLLSIGAPSPALKHHSTVQLARVPLSFEPNLGQFPAAAKFYSRGSGYSMQLGAAGLEFALRRANRQVRPLAMTWPSGNQSPAIAAEAELPGKANYFIGSDPKAWRSNVPTFERIRYRDVFPGIDLLVYGNQRQFEYDVVLAPGANVSDVSFTFSGAAAITIDREGDLLLSVGNSKLRQRRPVIYQEIHGRRIPVSGRYQLLGANRVGFEVAAYDKRSTLTIDPILEYSTYLGGLEGDDARGIAVDSAGNAYIVGTTYSTNFPTASALQPTSPNRFFPSVFVSKLNATGTGLLYSTYLGGTSGQYGAAIAVDSTGAAFITGLTESSDFPTTSGAHQTVKGLYYDAFVVKLSPAGSSLAYSTFVGSANGDQPWGIALDSAGAAYICGQTAEAFVTTSGAYRSPQLGVKGAAFVVKVAPDGKSLGYASLIGGTESQIAYGIAVDSAGSAYVAGHTESMDFPTTAGAFQSYVPGVSGTMFVSKLNPTGTALTYSTYLGGLGDARSITVNASNSAYVAGFTTSHTFPTTAGVFQPAVNASTFGQEAFLLKLNAAGSALDFSTFFGGAGDDVAYALAVDSTGSAVIAGTTTSYQDLPVTAGAPQGLSAQTSATHTFKDGFVAKFSSDAKTLAYSTYLGGPQDDWLDAVAVDSAGSAYVAGHTRVTGFPVTANAFQKVYGGGSSDAVIAKISDSGDCTYAINPASKSLTSAAQTFTIDVTAPGGCPWLATTSANWLSVSSGSPGSGNAAATFAATANTGPSRSGNITLAGKPLTVTQAGNCQYSVDTTPRTVGSAGTSSSVFVTAVTGCPWTHQSNADWIQLSGPQGDGQGQVAYFIPPNLTSSPRTGTLTVAGHTITVTQAGGFVCTYLVSPTSVTVGPAGVVDQQLAIRTQINCAWVAIPSTGWITVGSGTGIGNGTLTYTVSPYNSGTRTGTINVGGAELTITQIGNNVAPTPTSFRPTDGNGSEQGLSFTYTDPNGGSDLSSVYFLINTTATGSGGCYLEYNRTENYLRVANDPATAFTVPVIPGTFGTSGNSQCAVNAAASSARVVGNTIEMDVLMAFRSSFAGQKNVYGLAYDNAGLNSGLQLLGVLTVTASTNAIPTVNSISPLGVTGSQLAFTAVFGDADGSFDLTSVYLHFANSTGKANACYLEYNRQANFLRVAMDSGTAFTVPVVPGGFGTSGNSQCGVSAASSSAVWSGNILTLTVYISFKPGFAGSRTVYGLAYDTKGDNSGLVSMGTFLVSASTNVAPTIDFYGATGSGNSREFQVTASDSNGVADLTSVYLMVSPNGNSANACYVEYNREANLLRLANDAGNSFLLPVTPGSGQSVSNTQCTITAQTPVSSSTTSIGITFHVTFKPGFSGQVYAAAYDTTNATTGFVQKGNFP